jgi:hypothetical protein
MSYPINYPTPQNANVQIFSGAVGAYETNYTWNKPQGASFVWFTLIGAGGPGDGVNGGGSGAVTNFMCPAFLIPDQLSIVVGVSASYDSKVVYKQKNTAGYVLLTGTSATSNTGAAAMTANYFTAMGFFQSIGGQNGVNNLSSILPSSTTFLSGGGADTSDINANYGYATQSSTGSNRNGTFQTQPIIFGLGGAGSGAGGIGCGCGSTQVTGGNGLVVIITW